MQSATYQHIVEQGYNRGYARGVEQGIEKGIEKGILTGRVEATRALIARMLRTRFPDAGLEDLAERCPAQELEALADQILLSPNAEDLRRWLLARAV
jgi:predicted transposase YdaD